ncbi:LOW QUALITY PROTEIN: Set domain-containing hypothetical protein [Phytophthora megakarya]|uniref:Uncharacterized protein n=1 Tax=Phytophthora megakarya TaxID=4795 RepID=A0A225WVK7_9STRA|nr:LOW QUALITY PROTEIN: Set domain-containing hypothetical protein [Phytophthora megakarya]
MGGLILAELPSEEIQAGATIEYYSRMFRCAGPPQTIVLRVDAGNEEDRQLEVDSGEMMLPTMMLRRVKDHTGRRVPIGERKLRTFWWRMVRMKPQLGPAHSMKQCGAQLMQHLPVCQPLVILKARNYSRKQRIPQPQQPPPIAETVSGSSTYPSTSTDVEQSEVALATADTSSAPEDIATTSSLLSESSDYETAANENRCSTSIPVVVGSVGGGNVGADAGVDIEYEDMPAKAPSHFDLVAVGDYLRSIPTCYERAKIRHQPKKRAGAWHVPHSRKRRKQK